MRHTSILVGLCMSALFFVLSCQQKPQDIYAEPLLSGEVDQNSVVLQSRLTKTDTLKNYDMPGKAGYGRFEYSKSADFNSSTTTKWYKAQPQNDFIIKDKISDLEPGIKYYYRLEFGKDTHNTYKTKKASFQTLLAKDSKSPVSFVMVTGMNYLRFLKGRPQETNEYAQFAPCSSKDSTLGFPGYISILEKDPYFWIGNGDNVYYDQWKQKARSVAQMRKHWHRLFSMPRFQKLLNSTPTYWMKDDHDFRHNDADTTNPYYHFGDTITEPTVEEGINTFIEQLPIADPKEEDPKTYRTYQVNKDLQIWMVENRDYRSPNKMKDTAGKTLWGKTQKEWLKRTLLESDATFKILISPTPMVGPDGTYKVDNHTNFGGFRYERNQFFDWLKEHNLLKKHFYVICGDRHWKYHSIHPTGVEEFSCGALVDGNSRLGVEPGDTNSTDPEGDIRVPYTDQKPTGGFMEVKVSREDQEPRLSINLYDEKGEMLYQEIKNAK